MKTLLVTLMITCLAPLCWAQDKETPTTIKEMVVCAVKNNPDIQVVEAEFMYTQAKVKHVLLDVTRQTIEYHKKWEELKKTIQAPEELSIRLTENNPQLNAAKLKSTQAIPLLKNHEIAIRVFLGMKTDSNDLPKSLEEMIKKALTSNPGAELAKAELRKVDAQLNQATLRVTQDIVTLYYKRKTFETALQLAKKQVMRMQKLVANGTAEVRVEDEAVQNMIEAEAEYMQCEAQLRYLLGLPGLGKNKKTKKK